MPGFCLIPGSLLEHFHTVVSVTRLTSLSLMKRSALRCCRRFFCVCVLLTVAPFQGLCENAVTTQRYDNARTGQNLSEKFLNTTNVQPETFGKLFTRAVDDEVYAQPLYVANVTVPKVGLLNVLYVATVNNSVYAFDADNPSAAAPLWHINLTHGNQI